MSTTKKILILAANPRDTSRLRLDEEVREIDEGLQRSKNRSQFIIQSKLAIRLRDLRRAMLDYEPQIVHFCGHGETTGLMVEDEKGSTVLVGPDALAGLFELFMNSVECVLLNACYSEPQAEAINKYIKYVIGMSQGITDKAALEFAVGFYDALGAGKSIERSFKFGRNAIQLYNIPEYLTPILKKQVVSQVQSVLDNESNTFSETKQNNLGKEDELSSQTGEDLRRSSVPSPVLHNLPHPDYERFIGRDAELEQIRKLLSPKTRHFVITIDGIGGIGKSTLALEVADRYRRQYDELPEEERFDAIVWTTAKQTILTGEGIITRSRSLRTLEDIYTTIAITLQREDITRVRADEQGNLVCQALTQQRTLLIIDNLETLDDERVLAFIREVPDPTKIIVTTRHRIDVAYPIRLVAMPETEALRLIDNTAKQKKVTLTNNKSHQLCQRAGGIPLAIVWSVAQMGFGYSVDAVLTRLGQSTGDVAKFCFKNAMDYIRERSAYKLLLALSLFATDASREALGFVADLPVLERDDGLVQLEKLSLINKSNTRFNLLPLTKNFVSACLKEIPETEDSLRRAFINYFEKVCQKYGGEQRKLYNNLDIDLKNIQLALEWAYQLKMWLEVGELATKLVEFLDRRGLRNELVEYSEMAVEAGKKRNDEWLIMWHKIYGLGHIKARRFRKIKDGLASIKEGEKLALKLGDVRGQAFALRRKGDVYILNEEYTKAHDSLQDSLVLWQKLGDQEQEVRILGSFGSIERERGNLDGALIRYNEALKKAEEIGEIEQIALNTRRLSEIQWKNGQFEEALSNAQEALKINEKLNISESIARCCLVLAKSEYALNERVEDAQKYAKSAEEIFSKLGNKRYIKETKELLKAMNQAPNTPFSYLIENKVKGYETKSKNSTPE